MKYSGASLTHSIIFCEFLNVPMTPQTDGNSKPLIVFSGLLFSASLLGPTETRALHSGTVRFFPTDET